MKVTPLSIRRKLALEIARYLEKQQIKEHPLRQLFWECTLRCNLDCRHCGSDCKKTAGTKDMPLEDFLRVLDSVAKKTDPHRVIVVVTGGEPLMRKDLEECGSEIYRRGFPWGMVTNGLAMTEKRFKELMASGLRSMAISFDGMKDNHNWMRQHPLAFDGATRAIKLAAATPSLTWDVVTCVNQRTINQLDEMREYLWSIGVRNWRLITIDPMGRAAENPELLLSPEQHRYLLDYIREKRQEGQNDPFVLWYIKP